MKIRIHATGQWFADYGDPYFRYDCDEVNQSYQAKKTYYYYLSDCTSREYKRTENLREVCALEWFEHSEIVLTISELSTTLDNPKVKQSFLSNLTKNLNSYLYSSYLPDEAQLIPLINTLKPWKTNSLQDLCLSKIIKNQGLFRLNHKELSPQIYDDLAKRDCFVNKT